MPGKCRPSLRAKTLDNVMRSNLSVTDKECIKAVFDLNDVLKRREVEPVRHGRWENILIAKIDTTGDCTNCGQEAVWRTRNKPYAVCPNCGAKMDGE